MTAAAALLVAGCSSSEPGDDSPLRAIPGEHITRSEWNARQSADVWPLTVDEGTVTCVPVRFEGEVRPAMVLTTSDGTQYALNGVAWKTGRYKHLDGIVAADEVRPSGNIAALTQFGFAQCPELDSLLRE